MREVREYGKDFFNCIKRKRKTRENVGPMLNEMGALIMGDTEKMELLNVLPSLHQSLLVRLPLRNPRLWN